MRMHDEFSGTITLTENSSRELFKVLQEQDEAFINDVLCGRCGFTLKSADGRSVELVPNTNKRCQSVESVEADTPQTESQRNSEKVKSSPQTEKHECVSNKKKPCTACKYYDWEVDEHIGVREICYNIGNCQFKKKPQTDCGWGEPITVSHSKEMED